MVAIDLSSLTISAVDGCSKSNVGPHPEPSITETAMRVVLGILLSIVAGAAALAAPAKQRWTTGYTQGTVNATIRNVQGASLDIYCPAGGTPGMFIEAKTLKPAAQQTVDVQFVVDGKSHPFQFDEIQFQAKDAAGIANLGAVIDALAKSRSSSFVMQLPKLGTSETFSLAGARKALASSKDFLEECNGKHEQ